MESKAVEKAIDKIKKLLALSEKNSNSNEAQLALLKAQKLMVEFDVTLSEVTKVDEIKHFNAYCTHKWDMGYRFPLANVISTNFRCKVWVKSGQVVFLGRELDARICKETFEYAYHYIYKNATRKYDKAHKEGQQTKGVFNSYTMGFITGLKEAFDEQCRALVIITPEDVEQKFLKFTEGFGEHNSKLQTTKKDVEAYVEGMLDGKSFLSNKQLETA